jgi:hypothetical protein
MPEEPKDKQQQVRIEDLPADPQEATQEEADNVKGGATGWIAPRNASGQLIEEEPDNTAGGV